MKKQLPLIIGAVAAVMLVIAYFVWESYIRLHPNCETVFEQTSVRLGGKVELLKIKGELVLGREAVQGLTEGSQKVAVHLRNCCVAQQMGLASKDQYQTCVEGAKDYESRIQQVTININEAQAAKDRGNTQLAGQKTEQAKQAATAASGSERDMEKAVKTLPSPALPPKPGEPKSAAAPAAQSAPSASLPAATSPDAPTTPPAQIQAAAGRTELRSVPAPEASSGQCCSMVPNPELRRLGRLVVAYPEGANASGARLDIYKIGENKSIGGGYGKQAVELLPGSYAVVISGKRVEEVPIRSGYDTKLRVGVLRVTAGKDTRIDLLDPASKKTLTGGYGSQQFGLPAGKVDIRVAGQSETVTVKDGQITDF